MTVPDWRQVQSKRAASWAVGFIVACRGSGRMLSASVAAYSERSRAIADVTKIGAAAATAASVFFPVSRAVWRR